MTTTRARSKPRHEFKDLFRVAATKEEIQSDVLNMIDGVQKMSETSDKQPEDFAEYQSLVKLAGALRAEADDSSRSKRTRKRKRAFEIETLPPRHRRTQSVPFRSGESAGRSEVVVGS